MRSWIHEHIITPLLSEGYKQEIASEYLRERFQWYDDEDENEWYGGGRQNETTGGYQGNSTHDEIRELAEVNAYCFRGLKLYEMYVFGSEFSVSVMPKPVFDGDEPTEEDLRKQFNVRSLCDVVIREVHDANSHAWCAREYGRRAWRDGDSFTRLISTTWPTRLRFIDREAIGDPVDGKQGEDGIIVDPQDAATPLKYVEIDPISREKLGEYAAEEVVHVKLDVDSNVRRGVSRFHSVWKTLKKYVRFVEIEIDHRSGQAKIVMVRKINGSPTTARAFLDNRMGTDSTHGDYSFKREYMPSGASLTSSKGLDIEFKQPQSNFSDASPLASLMLKEVAACTGWTYTMLSADTGEGNLANSIVAESPVHQMILLERSVFLPGLKKIYKAVLEHAVSSPEHRATFRDLGINQPQDLWLEYELDFAYGNVVATDPVQISSTVNSGIMNGSMSRAEGSRRLGCNPERMKRERIEEADRIDLNPNFGNQNPDLTDQAASSQANNTKGRGSNQGAPKRIRHKDKKNIGGSQNT